MPRWSYAAFALVNLFALWGLLAGVWLQAQQGGRKTGRRTPVFDEPLVNYMVGVREERYGGERPRLRVVDPVVVFPAQARPPPPQTFPRVFEQRDILVDDPTPPPPPPCTTLPSLHTVAAACAQQYHLPGPDALCHDNHPLHHHAWLRPIASDLTLPTAAAARACPVLSFPSTPQRFAAIEFKCYSQNTEDGILLAIFAAIGTTNKRAVEIAGGLGWENNAINLVVNFGFDALFFDGDPGNTRCAMNFLRQHEATRDRVGRGVWWSSDFVTRENINALIYNTTGWEGEIDLFSLDMDGVDWWIWDALAVVRARVVVVEIQELWGADEVKTRPYRADHVSPEIAAMGASLGAFAWLAAQKGYRLVGCIKQGFNAFFVREDVPGVDAVFGRGEYARAGCFAHVDGAWRAVLEERRQRAGRYDWVDPREARVLGKGMGFSGKRREFDIADTAIARTMQRYRNTSLLQTVTGLMQSRQSSAHPTKASSTPPILALTDTEFTQTPFNLMIASLQTPASETFTSPQTTCDADFGHALVTRWRAAKQTYCGTPDANNGSRIDCYFIQQTHHGGSGDNLCVLHRTVLDLGIFSNQAETTRLVKSYVASKHTKEPYPVLTAGVIQAQCTLNRQLYQANKFPGWNRAWLWDGLQTVDALPKCDMHETRTTILVQRDGFANLYHSTEDLANTFLAMGILELAVQDVQVFLADLYPWGPFATLWTSLFGRHNQVLTAWDIKQRYGRKRVCFDKAIVGIYGPASPFCLINPPTKCTRSPIFRAYSDFVVRGLNLQHAPRSTGVTVNWMSRRSSVLWPERAFCDNRFFQCDWFAHLGTRSLARVVWNDEEITRALAKFCKQESSKEKPMTCVVSDYNTLSFVQQVERDRQTDVMVGPHGAGLTHQAFLPDRACVIELFVDGSSANQHFHNMARWRGRVDGMYQGLAVGNPVPVDTVVEAVRRAVGILQPAPISARDLGILILTCNRQMSLEALLTTLLHVDGIQSNQVYVSIDCNPGPLLNATQWSARGLNIQIIDSHQRHVVDTGAAKARRDERVTRHWLHAVTTALRKHEHVLYLEDDHLVHPAILHDADVLLSAQPTLCPTCFAVQLGCHRDCWGMASAATTASDVGRMEPGNMGVVYSRSSWTWFLQHIDEYCSIYGIWDVNMHHVLSVHTQHQHALTFLKSRVVHNSGCGSDRNTGGRAECDDAVLQRDRERLVAQDMAMDPVFSDRGTAKMPDMTIHNTRAIQADDDTKTRCMQSTSAAPIVSHKEIIKKEPQNAQLPVFLCFCFDNELDLLHIKLEKLSHVVTKFIISESTYSARGLPKPPTFLQHKNESRWQRFLPQIVHLVDRKQPHDTGAALWWYQISHVKDVIAEYLATDPEFTSTYSDGIVVMSDMDENASTEQIKWLQRNCCAKQETITFDMPYYFYGLHWKANNLGATTMTARRLQHELRFWALLQQKRKAEFRQYIRNIPRDIHGLQDGVHCSYCGTDAENVEKLQHVIFVDGPPFLGQYYWDTHLLQTMKACGVKPNGESLVYNPNVRHLSAFLDRSEYVYLFQQDRPNCATAQISSAYQNKILPALLTSTQISIQWTSSHSTQYTLQIFIPFSRIRVRMLCFLLNNLQVLHNKYHHMFAAQVILVRTGQVTDETTAFWKQTTSTQSLFQQCQATGTAENTSAFTTPLIVMPVLPEQAPFPVVLQQARPTATQHAEPDRMRQTWDYIQILRYAFTRRANAEYTLVLEDDIKLCPDFFATLHQVLERPRASAVVKQDLPVFVGGFGASALGYPTAATAGLAEFLQKRIRDSNLDVLISKGLDPKSKWFAPVGQGVSVKGQARDIWMPAQSCVYKPNVFLVLHRGGKESNFGVEHTENAQIRCGVMDTPRFFVHEFAETVVGVEVYRSCP